MTRQRALILEILQHSPKHLTADEIFAIAREKMPGIARGTVYRNLKLMEQAMEIARNRSAFLPADHPLHLP